MEMNQSETASIPEWDIGLTFGPKIPSEDRRLDDAATERPSLANFQILPCNNVVATGNFVACCFDIVAGVSGVDGV